jgi:hypothetical protein
MIAFFYFALRSPGGPGKLQSLAELGISFVARTSPCR